MTAAARGRLQTALVLAVLLLLAAPAELQARGGGRGGGGFRGGGGGLRGGGGFSRGGVARQGSIGGYDRSRAGGYPSRGGDARSRYESTSPGDSRSRSGSFENRRGETVDWDTTATRGEDGWTRDSSWKSSSGASGSGSKEVEVGNGRVQSVDRSRQAENAQGETAEREVSSKRAGDRIEREGSIETSGGIKADTSGTIEKTDDGFIAQGSVEGKDGAAAGTIVKQGDDVYARGAATDGDEVKYGRAHCSGGVCTGGTVTADIDDYYHDPYYYYPYYYGWYSCPGGVQTWYSRYGTPIYGCNDVTVLHTTIALGPSTGADTTSGKSLREAQVSSAPVLMYEVGEGVVVYATSYAPEKVYSLQQGERFFWAPGPAKGSSEAEEWIAEANAMAAPSANATVITYKISGRIVYLTNERPAPGFFTEPAEHLYAWIPGVRDPSAEERDTIRTAITAQAAGGQAALDREARKLEKDRPPPPPPGEASPAT